MSSRDIRRKEATRSMFRSSRGSSIKYNVSSQEDIHTVHVNSKLKDDESKSDSSPSKEVKGSVSTDVYYVDVSQQVRIPRKKDEFENTVQNADMPVLIEEESCMLGDTSFLPVVQDAWEKDIEWTDIVRGIETGADTNTASSLFFFSATSPAPTNTIDHTSTQHTREVDGIRKKVRNSVFAFLKKSNQRGLYASKMLPTNTCTDEISDMIERVCVAPTSTPVNDKVSIYVANPRASMEFQSKDAPNWLVTNPSKEITRMQKYEMMSDLPLAKYVFETAANQSYYVQTSLGTQCNGELSIAGQPTKMPGLVMENWENFDQIPEICNQVFIDLSNPHTTASFPDNDLRLTKGSVLSSDSHYLLRPQPQFEKSVHCAHARQLLPPWCTAAVTASDAYHWHRPKQPIHSFNASPISSLLDFATGAKRSISLLTPDASQIPPASNGQPARVLQTLSVHGARHQVVRSQDGEAKDVLTRIYTQNTTSDYTVKALNEQSASDGGVILVEHCTSMPQILQNTGMSSRISTYQRKRGNEEPKKHPSAIGATVVLGANDTLNLPLIQQPDIPSVTVQENQQYVHLLSKTAQPTVYCDFLMCNTALRKTEQPHWVLRSMPPVYVASSIVPKVSIPAPHSEEWETLKSRWANAVIQRYFSSESHIMDASIFTSYFGTASSFRYPGLSSYSPDGTVSPIRTDALHSIGVVAKWCKQYASTLIGGRDLMDMFNDQGVFQVNSIRNMTEERLLSLCSPEDTCIVQAVAVASIRLQLAGLSLYRGLDDRAAGRPVMKGTSVEQAKVALLKNNKDIGVQETSKAIGLRSKLKLINATLYPGFAQVTAWIVRALRRTPWYVSGAVHGYIRQQRFFFEILTHTQRGGKVQLPTLDLMARLRDEKKRVSTTSRGASTKSGGKRVGEGFASKFLTLSKKDVNSVLSSSGFSHTELLQMSASERRRVATVLHGINEVCNICTTESSTKRANSSNNQHKNTRVTNEQNWARETQKQCEFISSAEIVPPVSRSIITTESGLKVDTSTAMYENIAEEEDKQISSIPRSKELVVFKNETPEVVTKILPLFSPFGSEDYAEVRGVVPVPYYAPATPQVVKRVRSRVYANGKKVVYVDYILDREAVYRFKGSIDNPKDFIPPYEVGCASMIHDGKLYTCHGGQTAHAKKIGRKRKHTDEDDEAYEPSSYSGKGNPAGLAAASNTTYRRVKDPLTMFSSILLEALAHIEKLPTEVLHVFSKPVDKKRVPNYYTIVQYPMDLLTLTQRVKNLYYASTTQFREDITLLYTNSILFNGENSDLTRCAALIVQEGVKYLTTQANMIAPVEIEATKFKTQITMNQALLQIINDISTQEQAKPFLFKPVEKFALNYDKIIQRPMWLVLVKDRCNAHAYGSLMHFLEDIELIKENCFTFNTQPNHYLHGLISYIHALVNDKVKALPPVFQDFVGVSSIEDPKAKSKKSSKTTVTKKQREQATADTQASFARAVTANSKVGKMDANAGMDDDNDDLFDD